MTTIYFAKRAEQPRQPTGHFASNGDSPHEKSRYHAQQSHVERVKAAICRHNGDYSQAEIHDAKAEEHDTASIKHLSAALKP